MKPKNPILYSILEERRILISKGFIILSEDGAEFRARQREIDARKNIKDKSTNFEEIPFIASIILDLTPLVGDVKGIVEAIQLLKQGDSSGAKISLLSALPIVGIPFDVAKVIIKSLKK